MNRRQKMNDNKEFIVKTVKMLETILQRVDQLQVVFNKMEKRIDALENGRTVTISKTFTPENAPAWQDSMDEKLGYLTDKLKLIRKDSDHDKGSKK